MNVEVGIDSTGNSARNFYDGHDHPFLSFGDVSGCSAPLFVAAAILIATLVVAVSAAANYGIVRRDIT